MTVGTGPGLVVQALCDAMNAKDHQALAALFTEDAEFVSINGARLHGRNAIATGHARVFSQALAATEVSVTHVNTKFLNGDVVVCHAKWSRVSAADTIPATGTFTLVLHCSDSNWKIIAATNVQDAR